ncbi:MAG: helix-turn-helix domain-containing protein, partial [Bdellovibrio bacteriovorus]
MNPIQAASPDEQNVVDFSDSPGRRLRVLRQSKGWEIERIASQLHLRPHLVEALEQDRFHELPGPVFVMGYLRNYARLLGIDPEPLIGAYRASTPSQEPHAAWTPRPVKPEVGSGHILVRVVSLGLFLAVIAALVLWWQNRPAPSDEPTLGAAPSGVPLLAEEALTDAGLSLEEPPTTDALPEPGEGAAQSGPQDWGAPAASTDSPTAIAPADPAALRAVETSSPESIAATVP